MSELSYLEKLLDGVEVEWLPLSKVFNLRNGYTPSKTKKEFWANGDIPWFRMDDIRENGRILGNSLQKISSCAVKGGKLFPENSILISTSATIGEHALITVPHLANQRFTCLALKESYADCFDIKFLFYYCFSLAEWCQKNTTMSSFASVDMDGFKKFLIPRPCPDNPEKSLAIQSEIVRILDKFTALTAELTAELTMRKKQYNYYRDQLLSFDDEQEKPIYLEKLLDGVEVEWLPLGEVSALRRGRVMSKGYLTENFGPYPVYSSQTANNGKIGSINTFDFDGEYISWTTDGANAGTVFYRTGKFSITNVCGLITLKSKYPLIYKFLFYWLTIEAKKHVYSGMGNPKLMSHQVENIPVPILCPDNPEKSLAIQSEIVRILDKFDTLTNSITEGLPREIELRQKQYEYYRDLLFSFPKPETVSN
ncbi:restriction endonuclease subunit S [Escherichia coli]|uniref:restriction endonuclease subunit S n=1 Tax=Escherichia coli TaxID=562 RepID=UPI00191ABBCC|nr:restriction endonuclease subunit S [Escherichia coli]MCQ1867590.1 restriction endonuclease subunit S [Escherichia coli]MEB5812846.1 restriction endonuclease subunit S [Escherichia coli]CAD5491487.1 type I restriction-modification enzyme S subunit [Escherichia coli]CAD5564310.1 type I restriction-modification enzyme S subunit [Escherichia coli]